MRRRDFIKTGVAGSCGHDVRIVRCSNAAFAAAAQTGAAPVRFKITDIRAVKLRMVKEYGMMEQVSARPAAALSHDDGRQHLHAKCIPIRG